MAEKEQTTPVKLVKDYWPTENDRVKAGETIQVPFPVALDLIETGKATRADPLRAA